jgi:hypothetical protein
MLRLLALADSLRVLRNDLRLAGEPILIARNKISDITSHCNWTQQKRMGKAHSSARLDSERSGFAGHLAMNQLLSVIKKMPMYCQRPMILRIETAWLDWNEICMYGSSRNYTRVGAWTPLAASTPARVVGRISSPVRLGSLDGRPRRPLIVLLVYLLVPESTQIIFCASYSMASVLFWESRSGTD